MARKIEYRVQAIYPARSMAEIKTADKKYEKVVGRGRDASGIGFGERDMAWYYKQCSTAERAYSRLARFRSLKSVDLIAYDPDDIESEVQTLKEKVRD